MATNAAKELLKLIDSWKPDGSVTTARRTSPKDAEGLWAAEHRAVRYLAEIETFLATRDEAAEYKPLITQLRRFVFASDAAWDQNGSKLDGRDRMQLRLVGELMSTTPLSTTLDPVHVGALRDAIQECLDVLDIEPRQIEERANYLRYLLHRCLDILEGEEVDLLALRNLSFQASGVALGVVSELPEEKRKPFIDNLSVINGSWFSAATAGGVGNLLSQGITTVAGLIGS